MKTLDELIQHFIKSKKDWAREYHELSGPCDNSIRIDAAARMEAYQGAAVAAIELKENTDWVKIDPSNKATWPFLDLPVLLHTKGSWGGNYFVCILRKNKENRPVFVSTNLDDESSEIAIEPRYLPIFWRPLPELPEDI